jgi:phage-related protein
MSDFPKLNTGAVMQYPADRSAEFVTQVLRFVDGAEQRFAGYGTLLHRWVVRLDLLDEDEISRLAAFFKLQGGSAGTFSFTDPLDRAVYSSCSFKGDEMTATFNGLSEVKTTLTIVENRS